MTKAEAKQIAKLLIIGKQYKQGHYQHGYEYLEYDKVKKLFKYIKRRLRIRLVYPQYHGDRICRKRIPQKTYKRFQV